MTADAGRCVHLLNLPRRAYEDVFVLQHHGEIAHVSAPEGKAAGSPPMPCYKPSHDILLPALTPGAETEIAPVVTRRASKELSVLLTDQPLATSQRSSHSIPSARPETSSTLG